MTAPIAVLAVVLARVIAATPPRIVLPPTIGGEVSLNLFFCLVGNAGDGKGAAERAGAVALDLGPHEDFFREIGAGSGEGIAHLFVHRVNREVVQHTFSALLSVAEVDTLIGLGRRQGSTLMPELRKAWMGEHLGFAYADATKRLPVPAHEYRLNLLIGVQPARSAVLLDGADSGTPQRFLWLPTTDPAMPDETPDPPPRIVWHEPKWPTTNTRGLSVLPVCEEATRTIRAAHLARQRGQGDALDGHALLCRLKVAAALGILDGCAEVSDEDWQIAGLVMQQSDTTRTLVGERLRAQQRQANLAQGEAEGVREVVRGEIVDAADMQRACKAITRRLGREAGWVNRRDVRQSVTAKLRGVFDEAIDRLIETGQVEADSSILGGQETTRYRSSGSVR